MAMAFATGHRSFSVRRRFFSAIRSKALCPRRRRRQRYRSDPSSLLWFSSQSTYTEDPALAWARSNPRLARECLSPPPPFADHHRLGPSSAAGRPAESLESYLEWRGWTVCNHQIDDYDDEEVQRGAHGDPRDHATALISHVLSAPLTIASNFHVLADRQLSSSEGTDDDGVVKIEWCCVGARAEASIPTVYWEEFLRSSVATTSMASSSSGESPGSRSNTRFDLSIDFVGPDIPPKPSEQSVVVAADGDDGTEPSSSSSSSSLSLRSFHRGFYHDIPAVRANTKPWDAYLLFNPGLGHPNLRESWKPTLDAILQRKGRKDRRRQRLLLTAHSERDMARDAAVLGEFFGPNHVVYRENPFASRVAYEDPFETNHFVRPNHYVATVVI